MKTLDLEPIKTKKKKSRAVPLSVVVLLIGVVAGLAINAYLTFRLTNEIIATRHLAQDYADSLLGRILLTKYDDVATFFNKSIAQQVNDDLYFNFQKSAAAVEKLASLVSTTAVTRAKLFGGTTKIVFNAVASYASMVSSIAAKVQSIPPMTSQSEGDEDGDGDEEKQVAGVPEDAFNLLQEVTNVISELPDWAQHQLNVTDWKVLGGSCEQFFNNALSVEWDAMYTAYDWRTGYPISAEWEIPDFVLRDILVPIQSVCDNVATWNDNAIKEEEKRLHLARTGRDL